MSQELGDNDAPGGPKLAQSLSGWVLSDFLAQADCMAGWLGENCVNGYLAALISDISGLLTA